LTSEGTLTGFLVVDQEVVVLALVALVVIVGAVLAADVADLALPTGKGRGGNVLVELALQAIDIVLTFCAVIVATVGVLAPLVEVVGAIEASVVIVIVLLVTFLAVPMAEVAHASPLIGSYVILEMES